MTAKPPTEAGKKHAETKTQARVAWNENGPHYEH
jgi:hypothetical protein